ncbi:hypothetical protein [Pedobacter rhizosphaerae]|uniref:Uncharacterized protein n=1 Tax=Pedobacter rhizosphaerae TaxID=390241 RepID=A0A1H9TG55_9SPHI|nr:hypothetical protein [Pedobacter rhizosphaerae]SER95593.1 hypothetical protein SAMN04488023_12228 [Pedobacter rhizosphaerae]
MASDSVGMQAKAFLYELNNIRYEYGFSEKDKWILELTGLNGKSDLEKRFYPILDTKIAPDDILPFLKLISPKLEEEADRLIQKQKGKKSPKDSTYLIAYCNERQK